LTSFNSLLWATAAIAMTVHSTDAVNCTLDSALEKSDGSYASAWANQVSNIIWVPLSKALAYIDVKLDSVIVEKLQQVSRGLQPLHGLEL
jgi:hypothetical protein